VGRPFLYFVDAGHGEKMVSLVVKMVIKCLLALLAKKILCLPKNTTHFCSLTIREMNVNELSTTLSSLCFCARL